MFIEGLDTNSVKWVKEREIPILNSKQQIRIDSVSKMVNGGKGIGESLGGGYESGSDMDVSSDSDIEIFGQEKCRWENGGNPFQKNEIREDDEWSDSVSNSEFVSTQVGSNSISMNQRGTHSEGYSSSVLSQVNLERFTEKDFNVKCSQNKIFDDEVPSAPPLGDTQQGGEEDRESRSPLAADSDGFLIRKDHGRYSDLVSGVASQDTTGDWFDGQSIRTNVGAGAAVSSTSLPARLPTFHASALGPWHAVLSYDACVRLCLHAWANGCTEASVFLDNECALLRTAFCLQHVLLQSEEELFTKRSSDIAGGGSTPKPKTTIGKMKVQVRKVRIGLDPPTRCSFSSLHMESFQYRLSNIKSKLFSGWREICKVRLQHQIPANSSFSEKSVAYINASGRYLKQVSKLVKNGVTTLSSSSYEVVQETHTCLLRLKSAKDDDVVKMQPGSDETHIFFPDSLGDDLIVEVQDSKGKYCGHALAQVATIAEELGDKVRWWSIYHEPEHELVGRIKLNVNYCTSAEENGHLKYGSVAETVTYDLVLEVAMKVQHFQQRNLLLYGHWKWLLTEFANYYGVSDAYTKLRYLSYVMDVATPTADCLNLVLDLLLPVIIEGHNKGTLSHQENRILAEVEDRIKHILALVFENYKSLDESSPSGLLDIFRPATGSLAPALAPAVMLYTLLHDILSSETQMKLCSYFQVAAKKRSRRHLAETDEFVTINFEGSVMDALTFSTAYQKMRSLCLNIRNEVLTDIEIHNQHLLPSFIDLPKISSPIYSLGLCTRLRAFLVACPPTSPSQPVTELVIATSDLQMDLASWKINPIKGGIDAKELFHSYIILWIQDKRLSLLESCKLHKIKWSGVRTRHSTTPLVDEIYDQLKETLSEYEVIICRWPEYTFALENAVADVEKALVEVLEKQCAEVLAPLKDNLASKKFGLKYVQILARHSVALYTVPEELGVLLNSMKRMLDVLRPRIVNQLKSWGSCLPDQGNSVPGERLSEITVMLRAKFRNYMQAIVEKLVENTKVHNMTKLKTIIQDSKETVVESDVRSRMQPLKDQLAKTIDHLHTVFETRLFLVICRRFWDRMGKDVLSLLENSKENRSWYKGARFAVAMLEDIFASQMQQLLGNSLEEKDVEPPRSIMEVRSVLCKDPVNHKDSNYYF